MKHAAAAAAFLGLAILWSFPLAAQLSTHLPGPAGDNFAFLWNFWWMRTALASGQDFFHTPYLFAPAGIDLTLYTHTALPAFAGATLLGGLPLVAAHNLALLGSLFLNGFCTYALAWRTTRDATASAVAGIVFGASSFIAAHLTGHFNLTTAWTIPLFALAASAAIGGRSLPWAVLAGLILGLTAYIDYYYVIFASAWLVCLLLFEARQWSVSRKATTPGSRRVSRVLGIVILINAVLLLALALTGGFRIEAGPLRLSVRSAFNPLQIFWGLTAIWLWVRFRPRISSKAIEGPDVRSVAAPLVVLGTVFLLAAAPILWHAVELLQRGEYATQRYHWRSAPKGIDIATLILGHPWHGVWGGAVRQLYGSLGIATVEATAWLGIVAPLIAVATLRRHWTDRRVRLWALAGGVFGVWALGPHLMAFGANTAMILPQTLLRYVPIVANARMPGRAMILVHLALAIVTAIGLAEWRRRAQRPSAAVFVVMVAVLLDLLPAPFPTTALDRPPVYDALRARAEQGAVLELPFGIRDGFGQHGLFDDRVLYYQSIHGRPLTGGSASRIAPPLLADYQGDPLLSTLLAMSAGAAPAAGATAPDRPAAATLLARRGIAFVVLNRATASPALTDYAERVLPLEPLVHDGNRSLYRVVR